MYITSPRTAWQQILAANSSAASFSAWQNTTTLPVTTSTVAIITVPEYANSMLLKIYGTAANDQTGSVAVHAISRLTKSGSTVEYDGQLLAEIAATLSSTPTGATGGVIGTTGLFADTMALTKGDMGIDLMSPQDNRAAVATIDVKACDLIRVDFKVTTATNLNGILRFL